MKEGEGNLEQLIEYLQGVGTNSLAHSNRTLLTHLQGVHDLLKGWGNAQSVCFAGLFHSVYGTTYFKKTSILLERREEVRTKIGEEAEELVYLFCACDRPQLVAQMNNKKSNNNEKEAGEEKEKEKKEKENPFKVADRFTQQEVFVDKKTFDSLVEIVLANWVEQFYSPQKKKLVLLRGGGEQTQKNRKKFMTSLKKEEFEAELEKKSKSLDKSTKTWSKSQSYLSSEGYKALHVLLKDTSIELNQLKKQLEDLKKEEEEEEEEEEEDSEDEDESSDGDERDDDSSDDEEESSDDEEEGSSEEEEEEEEKLKKKSKAKAKKKAPSPAPSTKATTKNMASSPSSSPNTKKGPTTTLKGIGMIGKRVKVNWKEEKQYYKGLVTHFDTKNNAYLVKYDHGPQQWEERKALILLIPNIVPSSGKAAVPRKAATRLTTLPTLKKEKNGLVSILSNKKIIDGKEDTEVAQLLKRTAGMSQTLPEASTPKGMLEGEEGAKKLERLIAGFEHCPNHFVRMLSFAVCCWAISVGYLMPFSLLPSMFLSSLLVTPLAVCSYVILYQVMKTRTLAIVPPKGGKEVPIIVSINRFDSPTALQKKFESLFPSLEGKRVIGLCEENVNAVERSVIPLSMISHYALDCYMSIVYEIVAEDEECLFPQHPRAYPIHTLFNSTQMENFQPGFTKSKKSDGRVMEEEEEAERKKARARFCEELRLRGFAFVKVPRNFRYWKSVDAAIDAAKVWFYSLEWKEKSKCSFKKPGGKNPVLGHKKEQGREFVEIRVPGTEVEKKINWWPSTKSPRKLDENDSNSPTVDQVLVDYAFDVFARQQNFSTQFLEILTEGMGAPKDSLSKYLESYPVAPKEVSSCMYRLYRYNSAIMVWWKQLPFIRRFYFSPPHADLGLVTVGPRSAMPGLQAVDLIADDGMGGRGKWIDIEHVMTEEDICIFVGNTMGHVSNGYYRPMLHKVMRPTSKDRYSLPFFLRFSDSAVVPSAFGTPRSTTIRDVNKGTGIRRSQLSWRNPVVRYLKAQVIGTLPPPSQDIH